MKTIFTTLFTCLIFSLPVAADTITGKVVGIADGDTVTVLDASKIEYKIRLAGIDAPEKAQAFGNRSKEHLSGLVYGKSVTVDWNKKDAYGRTVGKILVAGTDANLAQIQAGMAWHYKKYQNEQSSSDRASYSQAEDSARTHRTGLWADPNPIPPSDFRHSTGDASPTKRTQAGDTCPCGGTQSCTGSRGGIYCFTNSGNKKYF
jgi:endonuclease YncB( thermonuclease family)